MRFSYSLFISHYCSLFIYIIFVFLIYLEIHHVTRKVYISVDCVHRGIDTIYYVNSDTIHNWSNSFWETDCSKKEPILLKTCCIKINLNYLPIVWQCPERSELWPDVHPVSPFICRIFVISCMCQMPFVVHHLFIFYFSLDNNININLEKVWT